MEQSTPSGIDLGLVRQSSKGSVESDGLSASLASKHVSCYSMFVKSVRALSLQGTMCLRFGESVRCDGGWYYT